MERPDFLNYMAQYSLLMLNHIWRSIPASNGAAIDTDRFMSAFSMSHEGRRITAAPWPEGPDGRAEIPDTEPQEDGNLIVNPEEPSRIKARRTACLKWVAHLERYSAFIPLWSTVKFADLREKILINAPSGRKKGMSATYLSVSATTSNE